MSNRSATSCNRASRSRRSSAPRSTNRSPSLSTSSGTENGSKRSSRRRRVRTVDGGLTINSGLQRARSCLPTHLRHPARSFDRLRFDHSDVGTRGTKASQQLAPLSLVRTQLELDGLDPEITLELGLVTQ